MSDSDQTTIQSPGAAASPRFAMAVWRRLRTDRLAMAGLMIIATLFVVSYFAPVIANNKPIVMRWQGKLYFPAVTDMFPMRTLVRHPELAAIDYDALDADARLLMPVVAHSPYTTDLPHKLEGPSRRHWMGTDGLGRDLLSRMVHGASVSLRVGFVAVGIALVIGLLLGALAGYYGGVVDTIVSRAIEVVMCFPSLFLILSVIAFLPPSIVNIMIVIGITRWTGIARYARGEFMKIKAQDYATAARALGLGDRKIIFRHILPNSLAPVLVTATFGVANAVLIEAALSFLGLGTQPPTPSWGGMLANAQEVIEYAWWLTAFPGLAIFVTVTAYNMLGEGLRDASDPRLNLSDNR